MLSSAATVAWLFFCLPFVELLIAGKHRASVEVFDQGIGALGVEDPERSPLAVSLERGRPLGEDGRVAAMAGKMGLEHILHAIGRPKKQVKSWQ